MNYSQRIKELREKNSLTQARLGELIGVSGPAVFKWEKGKSEPDISALKKMAELFGVTTDYIVGTDLDRSEKSMREILDADPITTGINTLAANGADKAVFTEAQKQELQQLVRDAILRYDKEQKAK